MFSHHLSIFSLNIDTLFPKQQVETLNPPSVSSSHYDNQLASDSIKSAIGMSTQQSQSQQLGVSDDNKKNSPLNVPSQSVAPSSSSVVALGGALPQRQGQRQQRSKLPPPSTKVCLNYRHLPWRLVQSTAAFHEGNCLLLRIGWGFCLFFGVHNGAPCTWCCLQFLQWWELNFQR